MRVLQFNAVAGESSAIVVDGTKEYKEESQGRIVLDFFIILWYNYYSKWKGEKL